MTASGLPDTPTNRMRVEDATWIDIAIDNTRAATLRGELVEVTAFERLVAARNSILPSPREDIRVAFVYRCIDCRAERDDPPPDDPKPAQKPADASTIAPDDIIPANAPVATPDRFGS